METSSPVGDDGPAPPDGERAQQIRGSSALLAGRLFSLAVNLVTQVVAVRHLSVAGYGVFAYGLGVAAICGSVVSPHADVYARFFAVADDEDDDATLIGTLAVGLVFPLVVGTALLAAAWAFRDALGSSLDDVDAVDVVVILVALAPVEAVDGVLQSLCAALGRVRAIVVRKYLLAPLSRLAVVAMLVAADGGARFLAVGHVIAAAFGVVVYVALVAGLLRARRPLHRLRTRTARFPVRAILVFALPFLVTNLVYDAMTFFTVVVLGQSRGPEEVAAIQAVLPAARLGELATWTFGTLYFVLAARLASRGAWGELRETYWHTATWMAVLTFPIFLLTVPFASTTTVALFGERYEGSAPYLALLAASLFLDALLGLNEATLQILERVRFLVVLNVTITVVSVGATIALVPTFGAVGAVAVTVVARVAVNVSGQVALATWLDMPVFDAQHARLVARLLAIAAPLAVLGWFLDDVWSLAPVGSMVIATVVSGVAGLAAIAIARRQLRVTETFPELGRIPLLGRLL